MATAFSPTNIQSAIRYARNRGRVQPHPMPVIQNGQPYVRPRITGQVVGDEPIPPSRPSFGGPGGAIPPAGAPPATTPPPPGQVGLPGAGGGEGGGIGGTVPGRGSGKLSWNPQLIFPDTALAKAGALDSTYTNAKNQALTDFYSKYHTTLQDLGYMDPSGNYQEGNIDSEDRANRLLYGQNLSDEARLNTEQSRDAGLLFSGIRATNQERAQRETVGQLADLDISTPRALSKGYTDAEGYMSTLNNALIAAYNEAMFRKFGTYDYSYTGSTPTGQ